MALKAALSNCRCTPATQRLPTWTSEEGLGEAKAASPALMLHSTNLEQDIGRPLSVAWAFEPTRTRHIEVPVGVIKGNTGGLHSARTDGLSSHRVPSIVTGMLPLKLTGST